MRPGADVSSYVFAGWVGARVMLDVPHRRPVRDLRLPLPLAQRGTVTDFDPRDWPSVLDREAYESFDWSSVRYTVRLDTGDTAADVTPDRLQHADSGDLPLCRIAARYRPPGYLSWAAAVEVVEFAERYHQAPDDYTMMDTPPLPTVEDVVDALGLLRVARAQLDQREAKLIDAAVRRGVPRDTVGLVLGYPLARAGTAVRRRRTVLRKAVQ